TSKLPPLKRTAAPSDPSVFLAPVPAPPPPPLSAEPTPLPAELGQTGNLEGWSGYDLPSAAGKKVVSTPKLRTSAVPVRRQSAAPPPSPAPRFATEKMGWAHPPARRKRLPSGWLWSVGAAVFSVFAFAVFWIAFNTRKESDNVAEIPQVPVSRVLSPQ